MRIFHHFGSLIALLGFATAASISFAAPFNVNGFSLSPGAGYGIDDGANQENGGKLLDVRFTGTLSALSFELAGVGSTETFKVGSVFFNEPNSGSGSNRGIRAHEQDLLGVTAAFLFLDSISVEANVSASGTATTGRIDDPDVDFVLAWTPFTVDFEGGGSFKISLDTLSFSDVGTQDLFAKVELLSAGAPSSTLRVEAAEIPEPATVALVGLALAGLGLSRRRPQARLNP